MYWTLPDLRYAIKILQHQGLPRLQLDLGYRPAWCGISGSWLLFPSLHIPSYLHTLQGPISISPRTPTFSQCEYHWQLPPKPRIKAKIRSEDPHKPIPTRIPPTPGSPCAVEAGDQVNVLYHWESSIRRLPEEPIVTCDALRDRVYETFWVNYQTQLGKQSTTIDFMVSNSVP